MNILSEWETSSDVLLEWKAFFFGIFLNDILDALTFVIIIVSTLCKGVESKLKKIINFQNPTQIQKQSLYFILSKAIFHFFDCSSSFKFMHNYRYSGMNWKLDNLRIHSIIDFLKINACIKEFILVIHIFP